MDDVKTSESNNKFVTHKDSGEPKHAKTFTKNNDNINSGLKKKNNLKKNFLKGELKQNKNIILDDYNSANPINLNKNKIGNKNKINENLNNTFIDKKKKDNNEIEKLNKTYIEKNKKDNKELEKIDIDSYHTKNVTKKKNPENARNSQDYIQTYSTNYAANKKNNKKQLEIKPNKILNTEENNGLKKAIDNNKKEEKIRNNKSNESRIRARNNEAINAVKNKKKKK